MSWWVTWISCKSNQVSFSGQDWKWKTRVIRPSRVLECPVDSTDMWKSRGACGWCSLVEVVIQGILVISPNDPRLKWTQKKRSFGISAWPRIYFECQHLIVITLLKFLFHRTKSTNPMPLSPNAPNCQYIAKTSIHVFHNPVSMQISPTMHFSPLHVYYWMTSSLTLLPL